MDSVQSLQSDEYSFPYHYIPQLRAGARTFSSLRSWDFSESYTLAILAARDWIRRCELEAGSHLDVGCGDGGFLYHLHQLVPELAATGVDYDQRAVDWARMFSPQIPFIAGDIGEPDFVDVNGAFDSASLVEVIEHIPPQRLGSFMSGVARCLKPGGKLLVTVPHQNKPVEAKHYQHFTFKTLIEAVGAAFTCDDIRGFESRSGLKHRAKRLLQNRLIFIESPVLNALYLRYELSRFSPSEGNCGRILAEFTKAC